MNLKNIIGLLFLLSFQSIGSNVEAQFLLLKDATINVMEGDEVVEKAGQVLKEEIYKRSGIQLSDSIGNVNALKIVIGKESDFRTLYSDIFHLLQGLPAGCEDAFKILYAEKEKVLAVSGYNSRAVLYGVGYLLRKSIIKSGTVGFNYSGSVYSCPQLPLRGVILGANPKFKNVEERRSDFEQYLRELVLFGLNCVELSRAIDSSYVNICLSYGLKIGIVTSYRNGSDFSSPEGMYKELIYRERLFKSIARIDNYTIKSGDPGNLSPQEFFNFSEKEVRLLKHYHPNAKVWIAPQRFNTGTREYFEDLISGILKYDWIEGLVYAPWARYPIEEYNSKLKGLKPIRHMVDIGHIYSCQYPVNSLDLPLAISYGRVVIDPRPSALSEIHKRVNSVTCGSIQYSEGTNDDVNKIIWLSLDWDSDVNMTEVLEDYARFFIGPDYSDRFAKGLALQESSWQGAIENNKFIDEDYSIFSNLSEEQRKSNNVYDLLRFRMGMIRAYFDKYIKMRYRYETKNEEAFIDYLRNANRFYKDSAVSILNNKKYSKEFFRLEEDCKHLYSLIYEGEEGKRTYEPQRCVLGSQMAKPLNNRDWYLLKLVNYNDKEVNSPGNKKVLEEIKKVVFRSEFGEYFDLGSIRDSTITNVGIHYGDDPYFLKSPYIGYGVKNRSFAITRNDFNNLPLRNESLTQIGRYYDEYLTITFPIKNPENRYTLKINYTGEASAYKVHVKLVANGSYVIHDFIKLDPKRSEYSFEIPKRLYKKNEITLSWICMPGERGVTIADVFFEKK